MGNLMDHARTHPNTKARHAGETSAFFQSLLGFAIAALVMLGVGGTVYHLVSPGGWIAQLFGRSLAGGMAGLLALFMVGLAAWLTRAWTSVTQRNRYSEVFVYGFAATGLVYAVQMLMNR
jgi:hypothetical protein